MFRQRTDFDDRSMPCLLALPLPNTVTGFRLAANGVPDLLNSGMAVPIVAHS